MGLLIDLLSLPAEPKKTALAHMAINLTVVGLYAVNPWLRASAPEASRPPILLSTLSIGLLAISVAGQQLAYVGAVGVGAADAGRPLRCN